MFDPKLKEALSRVQKPGRYTGGEPGSVYKNKDEVDVRFAFCFPDTYEVGMSFLGEKILYELLNSGKLKAYKNGRNWLIPRDAVRQYVLEQAHRKSLFCTLP